MSVTGEEIRSKMFQTTYRLREGYFFAFPTPHELQIRTSHGAECLVRISMAAGEGWGEAFFTSLDGTRTLGELIKVVPSDHVESVLKIVAAMRREYLVESETPFAAPPQDDGRGWLHRLMAVRNPVRDWYADVVRNASVLVLGAGVLGSRVAGGLIQLGIGTVTVADASHVSSADIQSSPYYWGAEVGKRRSDELVRALRPHSRGTVVEVAEWPQWEQREAWQEMLKGRSLVIVADDAYRPRLLRHVNALALELDVRWSMLLVDGWDVMIGPTFLPHQTGCLTCWEHQRRAGWRIPDAEEQYVEFLVQEEPVPAFLGSPHFADVVSGLMTSDLLNLLGILTQRVEDQSSLTLGRQLQMQMKSFDAKLKQVIKDPRCPSCANMRSGRN